MTEGVELMISTCLVLQELLRDHQMDGDRIIQERNLYDLVLYITMEPGRIYLVHPVMDRQMHILVVGYQGVNKYPGRNTERKQQQ